VLEDREAALGKALLSHKPHVPPPIPPEVIAAPRGATALAMLRAVVQALPSAGLLSSADSDERAASETE
jgi:hypothetical protein